MGRFCFSGHESFHCKSLWLKKGYDYLLSGNSFTDKDAVIKLGVGKNMVSSIRFWLRAFGLSYAEEVTTIAHYLFNRDNGKDPFSEDLNTLWLLHFLLVNNRVASLYNLVFVDYQRERREFSRNELQTYIRRRCTTLEQNRAYNENTVKKDIAVLLKNYVPPRDLKLIEDFSSLLINLNLIIPKTNDSYLFREVSKNEIAPEIILFAILSIADNERTISLDELQRISLTFNLTLNTLVDIIRSLEISFPGTIIFSDNSGIKNLHLLKEIDKFEILNHYYNSI